MPRLVEYDAAGPEVRAVFDAIKAALKQPLIFDGRNIFDPALMRLHGIEYSGIGRSAPRAV